MNIVVVGASSGLGRCIGVGLARRGAKVALMARRKDKLDDAVAEAGENGMAFECDVTDPASCGAAIDAAVAAFGEIDALVYAPAFGPLARIEDTDVDTWRRVFDTNVIGASTMTAAMLPHLKTSGGRAIYLSSISASVTAPWPGLGAYAVSKAALEKLVEAWHCEHPEIGFTRLVVGDCAGGEGDSMTQFTSSWDMDLAVELGTMWVEKGLIAGTFIEVDELAAAIYSVLSAGHSVSVPTLVVTPRAAAPVPAPT